MIARLSYLSEIIEFQKNGKISIGIDHLDCITNSLFKLTQSLYDNKEQPKYYQTELEGKYFRFGLANHSILNLTRGNNFKIIDKDIVLPDTFSLNALTRMQIEAYLIMFYLFFDNVDDLEKDFRYDIYKIHGLQKQANFEIIVDTPETREQKRNIETELKQTIERMKSSSVFINAESSKQKQYIHPRSPKLIDSQELFKRSGLNKTRFDQMWQLFSNYAHNEHISDRQYNKIYKINKTFISECSLTITLISILTCRLCLNISNSFNGAKKVFEELTSKEKIIIEFWDSIKNKNIC